MVTKSFPDAVELLLDQCADLELVVTVECVNDEQIVVLGPAGERISVDLSNGKLSMIEQVLRGIRIDFDSLPVLVQGESKDIRLLTPAISVARLIPSVYSFTENRYGQVPGTELIRARFSADLFRTLDCMPGARHVSTAFLGLIESVKGPLLAERVVQPSNIEIRVKRYHIGSPLHRYRYTDRYPTARNGQPLKRWSRFETPIVCFDWRHPMTDLDGNRLADEPISDDYASVWLDNPARAKQLASDTFLWIEDLFARNGLLLIDICFFIDQTGSVIFGEISPDCMRVRSQAADESEAFDKDKWRSGGEPQEVLTRYGSLYNLVFDSAVQTSNKEARHGTTDN
ncbi:phosphoribosylaminoimidazolesuccinocarboxamide synthase [Collimonas silvisoli]|uniref:phosphoribosylaminoimidazolesuccinocarboxamide synthase n=1 Tax=Collimonas silvisoli TaxID=2825884 RepID=UPI001B8AC479|nr:phosphoribosylaminoimidazolesuccinocarboxamide synthase [Collimonas silvisoli]